MNRKYFIIFHIINNNNLRTLCRGNNFHLHACRLLRTELPNTQTLKRYDDSNVQLFAILHASLILLGLELFCVMITISIGGFCRAGNGLIKRNKLMVICHSTGTTHKIRNAKYSQRPYHLQSKSILDLDRFFFASNLCPFSFAWILREILNPILKK